LARLITDGARGDAARAELSDGVLIIALLSVFGVDLTVSTNRGCPRDLLTALIAHQTRCLTIGADLYVDVSIVTGLI